MTMQYVVWLVAVYLLIWPACHSIHLMAQLLLSILKCAYLLLLWSIQLWPPKHQYSGNRPRNLPTRRQRSSGSSWLPSIVETFAEPLGITGAHCCLNLSLDLDCSTSLELDYPSAFEFLLSADLVLPRSRSDWSGGIAECPSR
jgi:hypothetical protein